MIPKRTDEIRVPISIEPTVSSMADIEKGTRSDMCKKTKVRGGKAAKREIDTAPFLYTTGDGLISDQVLLIGT